VRKVRHLLRRRPRPIDPAAAARRGPPPPMRAAAWGVHFYTGLGLVAAAAIAVLIVRGDAAAFRTAFLLMVVATLIDATDGTLARAVQVKKVVPCFDGRRLDDLIDFLTYTFLPLLLIWRAGLLPSGYEGWLLAPLLASAYGFCQVEAKTPDGYFLGFPSYWNIVAFYLYALGWSPAVNAAWVVAFAVGVFVPIRYVYPSRTPTLRWLTVTLGSIWGVALIYILLHLHTAPRWLGTASLAFPIYYFLLSLVLHTKRRT
jgi:phosphatidylcholine synthase